MPIPWSELTPPPRLVPHGWGCAEVCLDLELGTWLYFKARTVILIHMEMCIRFLVGGTVNLRSPWVGRGSLQGAASKAR